MIQRIQICGERCSGTNYLEKLCANNLIDIALVSDYGFKHFFKPSEFPNSDNCLFIIIYRNPIEWLQSIYLQPYHTHKSLRNLQFSMFIRKEWHCVLNEDANVYKGDKHYNSEMMYERDPVTKKRFENILKLRSAKIKNFESVRDKVKYSYFIRYEDLKRDPKLFINNLSLKYKIKTVSNFYNIENYRGLPNHKYKPKIYEPIKSEDLRFILKNLDVQLEEQIGFGDIIKKISEEVSQFSNSLKFGNDINTEFINEIKNTNDNTFEQTFLKNICNNSIFKNPINNFESGDFEMGNYERGLKEGYNMGVNEGYNKGKIDGYNLGKDEGYMLGLNDGYKQGKNEGFKIVEASYSFRIGHFIIIPVSLVLSIFRRIKLLLS